MAASLVQGGVLLPVGEMVQDSRLKLLCLVFFLVRVAVGVDVHADETGRAKVIV